MSVKHRIFTTAQIVKAIYTIVLTSALIYNIFKYGVGKKFPSKTKNTGGANDGFLIER